MALLPSGDLLISNAEPNLKMICHTTEKMTKSKYSVAPLITGAIHVTLDDKIVIRTRKKGPVFPVEGTRQVVVMDIKGRTEKVYDLDNNGEPIFSAPQSIATDSDNNMYVLDRLNRDNCGRIVALDRTNGVRWIYNGNPNIRKGQVIFKPRDLAATKLKNLIITDMESNMIYILSSLGQCIHYLNTNDQLGILFPFSLKIDNRGTLYIGCSTYESGPAEAKIYSVKFSGFLTSK
ncbi:uncharacterized protein LOC134709868 [Mytilus trossulus]|uniref:uncharacterized protein LOC134709868 n=1 Tax=Mytilus trossulus TaxID=6551 RepID=UPI003007185A